MEPRIDYLKNGRGALEAMFGLEKYLAQSGLDHKLMTLISCALRKLTAVPTALTCIGKICGSREKANNGFMAWMPGENLLTIPSVSAPPWPGPKRSQTSSRVTYPTKSLRKHASISPKRNSPI